MGSGDKNHVFHIHLPHIHLHGGPHGGGGFGGKKDEPKDVPKGCLAITVGQGEEQQRFVIPVVYFNHPLFLQLLKEAEEEYGFNHDGPINIPCHVEQFRRVQGMIDKENSHHHHHHHGHGHHGHHGHHHSWCFKIRA